MTYHLFSDACALAHRLGLIEPGDHGENALKESAVRAIQAFALRQRAGTWKAGLAHLEEQIDAMFSIREEILSQGTLNGRLIREPFLKKAFARQFRHSAEGVEGLLSAFKAEASRLEAQAKEIEGQ